MDNNLFKFATKETAQDSFFSWIINWFNYKDKVEYYNFAKEFLKEISPKGLKEQIDNVCEIKIIRQIFNIDILLILNLNNGEQKFLIIENKTDSSLKDEQKNSILYFKNLFDKFNEIKHNEKSKHKRLFNSWRIECNINNIEENIYSVLIRTGLKYKNDFEKDEKDIQKSLNKLSNKYSFLKNERFFYEHINFINKPEKLKTLIEVFDRYKHIDKTINNYYEVLLFNLENDSVLNDGENSIEFIKNNEILEEDKTHFRTAWLCLSCFNKLLKSPIKIDGKINTRGSNRRICNLDISSIIHTDIKRKKIIVQALDFSSGNDFENFFVQDNIWHEKQEETNTDNIRYIFLFTKENDTFNNTYYTFRGLFRFINRVGDIKYWKKCVIDNNGKISIKKEEIEKYIKIEEDLSILGNENK